MNKNNIIYWSSTAFAVAFVLLSALTEDTTWLIISSIWIAVSMTSILTDKEDK